MKTKIRIQESESTILGAKYKHMYIQILTQRYKSAMAHFEQVGAITFQANSDEPNFWYGMRFLLDTDNANHVKQMAKISQLIKEKRSGWNAQPKEIIEIIGGEEHVLFDTEFISVLDKGKSLFYIMREDKLYEKIVAKDEAQAKRILAKKDIPDSTVQFNKVIQF